MIGRKKKIPTDGHPPRKGLMGGKCPDEAQGCRVMGKNEVSHNHNTPGTGIGQGYHLINLRFCSQKGWAMGMLWEGKNPSQA